ncbi:MAG: DNA polymerase III subunit delta [bacterium]
MPKISLFCGGEDFLLDEELKSMKAKYSEFNFERIDGEKSELDRIISALTTLPLLGGDRLVFIDSLKYDEKDEERLFGVLRNPDESVKAVFIYYDGLDKRRKFYKLIEKIGEIREFKKFSEWEQDKVLAWLVNRMKVYGKKIGGHAANLLIEITGGNLRMIDKEIGKISTYIGDRDVIEEDDVSKLASLGELDSFALSNALRNKNAREAVQCLNRLFKDNQDPHMLTGMLAKLYRMLLQVKYLEDKGLGQYDIAKELNAKPFFIKKCMERTGKFTLKELANDIRMLHLSDLKMKSGYSPKLVLEMLVPELCNG